MALPLVGGRKPLRPLLEGSTAVRTRHGASSAWAALLALLLVGRTQGSSGPAPGLVASAPVAADECILWRHFVM